MQFQEAEAGAAPLVKRNLLVPVAHDFLRRGCGQFAELLLQFRHPPLKIRAVHLDFRRERVVVAPAFQIRIRGIIIILVNAPLPDVREERLHRIKILRREGIEFVVVAFATSHRRAEPGRGHRAHAVGRVLGQILLGLRAAFASHHIETIEARGDELFLRRAGQQIAGDLFDGELVEQLIPVERINHVVAVRKDALVLVAVITHRVGEPHHVQPRHRHALAEVRRLEQTVHLAFVSFGTRIVEIGRLLPRCRRQTDQVETEATQQSALVRFGRRREAFFFERVQNKSVDGIPHPRPVLCLRQRGSNRFDVSPVRLVFRAFGNPTLEQFFLVRRQRFVRLRRRHRVIGVGCVKAFDEFALVWFAGNDRVFLERRFTHIQAQLPFALVFVRPVAGETVFGKDRPDVAIVARFRCGSGRFRRSQAGESRNRTSRQSQTDNGRCRRPDPFPSPRRWVKRFGNNKFVERTEH